MVVTVGVNEPFCKHTACVCAGKDTPRSYEWLADIVRDADGVDLRFSYFRLEDRLASALETGKVDGVIAKAWTALSGFRTAGIDCERVCDIPLPDGDPNLKGVFIAPADGSIRSIGELAGKRLGTGRPHSYENFYAVDRLLQELDVQPQSCQQYDCCVHAAVSVLEGDTDAAVVSSYCVRFGLDEILGRPGVFRPIGETAPIPFVTFALSTGLPGDLRARLKASVLRAAARGIAPDLFPGGLRPPVNWTPQELERV